MQRADLALPLPVAPTASELAAVLQSLIKHLLFQRAQIPFLYDQLLEQQQAQAEAEGEEDDGEREGGVGGSLRKRRWRRRQPKADVRLTKVREAARGTVGVDGAMSPHRCELHDSLCTRPPTHPRTHARTHSQFRLRCPITVSVQV